MILLKTFKIFFENETSFLHNYNENTDSHLQSCDPVRPMHLFCVQSICFSCFRAAVSIIRSMWSWISLPSFSFSSSFTSAKPMLCRRRGFIRLSTPCRHRSKSCLNSSELIDSILLGENGWLFIPASHFTYEDEVFNSDRCW